MKGQGSTEYIFMLAVALIIIVVAIAFALGIGGKATKGGGVKAELLGAEVTGNTLSIATNLPLSIASSAKVYIDGSSTPYTVSPGTQYNVSGGYEYVLTGTSAISIPDNSISSMNITGTTGTILLLPASGTNVAVGTGTAPFTISQIGS